MGIERLADFFRDLPRRTGVNGGAVNEHAVFFLWKSSLLCDGAEGVLDDLR